MSEIGASVSSRRSKGSNASSSLRISHAQARAELAMAKARAEFAKKKAALLRAQAIAAADLSLLNANEEVAACKAKADLLEEEVRSEVLSEEGENSGDLNVSDIGDNAEDDEVTSIHHLILPPPSFSDHPEIPPEVQRDSGSPILDKDGTQKPSTAEVISDTHPKLLKKDDNPTFTDRVNMWNVVPSSSMDETGIKEIVKYLQRPKHEVKKFGGNPLEFRKFVRQFQSRMVINTDTDDERLSYLEELTTGEAHKVVSGCSHLNAERAFKTAMSQLEERYGDNEVIASAYIKKALDWSAIKPGDAKALDELGLFLAECMNAAESIDATKVLEYPDNIRKLMEKLPVYLNDRWRNVVFKIKESKISVKFEEFVKFVRTEAKKINDPIFGRKEGKYTSSLVSGLGDSSKKERVIRQKGSTYTANAKPNSSTTNLKCVLCAGSHWLSRCDKFKSMTVKERKIVVREKGLCRNCLNTGHFVASCPKSGFCKICTDKHSSFLHPITRSNSNEANVNVAAVNASSGSVSTQPTSMALEKKHGRIGLAVIAVNVRCPGSKRFLTTYAFLDNGSNTTFCTNKLAIRLGAKGKTVNLDLMAMNGGSNENCQLISLEISGVDNGRSVIAPNVYSKSTLQFPIM